MKTWPMNNEEGFTLIEVLVSFVILSGAVIMTFQVFGDGLRGLHTSQTRAAQIAAAQTEIDRLSSANAMAEGTSEMTVNGLKLRVKTERITEFDQGTTSLLRPFLIRVYVGDGQAAGEPLLETIAILKPAAP